MTANIECRFAGKVCEMLIERGVSFSVGHQGDHVTFLIMSDLDIGMRKQLAVYTVLVLECDSPLLLTKQYEGRCLMPFTPVAQAYGFVM